MPAEKTSQEILAKKFLAEMYYKMRTPSLFIQHQITNLQVLAELLAAHVDGLAMPSSASRESLLCRESMLTISVLLPKLEATRRALQGSEEGDPSLRLRHRVCENCD